MITRSLARPLAKSTKSILLLGPRQTGKSTLISQLTPDITINLAHESTYLDFASRPQELESRLATDQPKTIFLDEIQRLPSLLNTIQVLLDKPGHPYRFYLTGSSTRKLRRGQANLLPGRIHTFRLGPLTSAELDYKLNSPKALSIGTLPGIWTDPDPASQKKTLRSYAGTYLKEEIQAEGLSRNLEGFARFLKIASEWAGRFLDLAKMAGAAQIPRQSAVRYFEILEDCLIVVRLDPFSKSFTRRLVQHPRFYFFDVGVLNGLLGNFSVSADRMGLLFEHLVVTQIYHSLHHCDQEARLSAFRTEHGAEVDLILERGTEVLSIEIKGSRNIGPSDLRGLERFADYYGKKHRAIILYLGEHKKRINDVELFPWQEGLKEMGL